MSAPISGAPSGYNPDDEEMLLGARRRRGPKIGPLKEGSLTRRGYSARKSVKARRTALNKTVRAVGALKTLRKVNAVAVYTKRKSPALSRTYRSDVRYLQKKYFKR